MADNSDYLAEKPRRPAREMYIQIRDSARYANFIRDQLIIARKAKTEEERAAAVAVLDSHFALSTDELDLLGKPATFSAGQCFCTNTRPTFYLLDFAIAAREPLQAE